MSVVNSTSPLPWWRRAAAPLLAGLLTGLVHLWVMIGQSIYPFGPNTRGQGDYITQYLAFHAQFRRLLLGDPLTSWQFTWTTGSGVPFLNDYTNYVGGPFPFLLVLFSENRVELGIMVMVVAKLVTAAIAMAFLLQRLSPSLRGTPAATLVIATLATGYAASSWVFDTGSTTIMWLDGLIAFPLLCLAALWTLQRRRVIASVVSVALVLWSNYYTAWMAGIGAVLFLVLTSLAQRLRFRDLLSALLRFAGRGAWGAALVALLVVPQLYGLRSGSPVEAADISRFPSSGIPATLLPGAEGFSAAPGLFAGSLALLLASSLSAAAMQPVRTRIVWTVGLVSLLASLNIESLLLAWQAFSAPHGNPFRFSFVLCGFIVVCAWFSVGGGTQALRWPSIRQLLLSFTVLCILSAVSVDAGRPDEYFFVDPGLWPFTWGVLALLVLGRVGSGRLKLVCMLLIATLTVSELALNGQFIYVHTKRFLSSSEKFTIVSQESLPAAEAATAASGWPTYRVGHSQPQRVDGAFYIQSNESARDGFPGVAYYSSLMPGATQDAYLNLSMLWKSGGRMLMDRPDPVSDAILSVRARSTPSGVTLSPALPMVRLVPTPDDVGASAGFASRNASLPQPVYLSASVTHGGAPLDELTSVERSDPERPDTITVRCPAGTQIAVDSTKLAYATVRPVNGKPLFAAPNIYLGVTYLPVHEQQFEPEAGVLRLPAARAFACFSPTALSEIIAASEVPDIDATPGVVRASFRQPVTGQVVVATTAVPGWSCSADGEDVAVTPRQGLLAIQVNEKRSVECSYSVPGLMGGTAVSALALAGLVLMTIRARYGGTSRTARSPVLH